MRVTKKPEERKLEISEAALELFLEKGYENVSVKDITTKVNVAAGLFHYYFHSKEDVLMECVRLDRQKFIIELNELKYFSEDKSAIEKINYLLSVVLHNILERTNLFRESYSINSAMLVEQAKLEVLAVLSDKLTEFIIQGNREKVFSCRYPRETAEIAVFGVNRQFRMEQERNPSLNQYLLGEYIYIEREKYRNIFMNMLNMKEPMGLFDFEDTAMETDSGKEK